MSQQRPTILEALVAGGRCTLARDDSVPDPESFADTVASLEATLSLALRVGELSPGTDTRALAILGAATVAGLKLARWELGPGADILAPYEIFARGALSAVARRQCQPAAWAS